ncbi:MULTISPECIES: DUF1254 domain-containing protein [unclassified Mesorhizobium]|jgi:uncharacterized membrane protein|uniref:DUF1254 domain-containing protein n=1 Tax=unclassified Mesorhizobium TaxID=325217 RepID=UPI0008E211A6|nr:MULTISPECIES: DUF1254 domain-containing protein [unclassified Mesorhizobium]RJG45905.1 DUF1254 domain-containing protein [Mesorhizobium sp. DCY119]SFT96524.1 Uncharacterized membrane protein [Mesorhizobium sp. YR577]
MLRLIHAIILGLLGAGIVHIAVLMMIPDFSERDAWSRLAMAADLYTATPFAAETGPTSTVKSVDPLFEAAACRFDLTDGVVQVRAQGDMPFWSVSVYNRAGQNIYSFNDRTTTDRSLNFVVLTPAQMIEVRKDLPEGFEKSIFVEAPIDEGIVVVRSFVPDDSWKQVAASFLGSISCEPQ